MDLKAKTGVPPGRAMTRLDIGNSLALYVLEDESFLYSRRSRSLFGLDGPATAILLRLAGGEPGESLMSGLDPRARKVAHELAEMVAGREPLGEGYRAEQFHGGTGSPSVTDSPCHRLLTTCFTLSCDEANLYKTVTDSLRNLVIPAAEGIDLEIGIVAEGNLWHLSLNGAPQGGAVPVEMLLPLLYDCLRKYAYQRTLYLLAVHAAVVSDGHRTIVFPGESGSGKSTLAATLLARGGYRLLSDEVALVSETGELVSIPLPLGVKSGSWALLENEYPHLAGAAEHVRWDGNRIRYLWGDEIGFWEEGGREATHLCFPLFRPGGRGRMERLTPVTALRHLTTAGYQVRDLHEESAERIVSWLRRLSCSIITYASTDEALQLLDGALDVTPAGSPRGGSHVR